MHFFGLLLQPIYLCLPDDDDDNNNMTCCSLTKQQDTNDNVWILHLPANRLVRKSRHAVVPVVSFVGCSLVVTAVVAPVLWWLVASNNDDTNATPTWQHFVQMFLWQVVPRMAAALLALHLCICCAFVAWQHHCRAQQHDTKNQ